MTRSSRAPPRPSSPLPGEEDATAGCDDADVRAMTVVPGQKGTAGIEEVPDPDMQDGALLVRGMAVGVCGTDREIAEGAGGVRLRARRSGSRDRAAARSNAVPGV
jgi:hypothetical protein